jgi:hypothetical protein
MSTRHRRLTITACLGALAGVALSAHAITGPSSSASPYILRAQPGVVTTSILTVGDSVNGYRLAGIPDGLGTKSVTRWG